MLDLVLMVEFMRLTALTLGIKLSVGPTLIAFGLARTPPYAYCDIVTYYNLTPTLIAFCFDKTPPLRLIRPYA